jgi:hypothetical protein
MRLLIPILVPLTFVASACGSSSGSALGGTGGASGSSGAAGSSEPTPTSSGGAPSAGGGAGGSPSNTGGATGGGLNAGGGSTSGAANGGSADGGSTGAAGGVAGGNGGGSGANGGSPPANGGTSSTTSMDGSAPKTSACKRGVAYGFDPAGATADMTALSSGVSWFYNWSSTPPSGVANDYQKLGVEYVPMLWNGNFDVDKVVQTIPAGAKFLLGFNEPNFTSQANLTPAAAAALWPKVEEIASRRNLSIVSPAVNYCGGGCNVTNPVDWMDQFFAACENCKIDYVAIHWYACSKSALTGYVADFKKYDRPIWLTEFACGDQGTVSEATEASYQKDAVAYLESDPDIFRYAWFSGRSTSIANVDLLGSAGMLTSLGDQYTTLPAEPSCTAASR